MSNTYNSLDVISAIVGMSSVKRFHGRETIKTQTIADHSGRVAQVAFFLALEFYGGDRMKANEVSVLALWHDFPESLLECDIPTHVKNMGNIGEELKQVEMKFVKNLFPGDTYLQDLMMEVAQQDDFFLMKLADYLDFGFYVRNEVSLGNSRFEEFLLWFQKGLSKFPQKVLDLPTAKAAVEFVLGPQVKVI
jgi:5'-deoxynucleotidase YfbR-like HD superfamily hydrolase